MRAWNGPTSSPRRVRPSGNTPTAPPRRRRASMACSTSPSDSVLPRWWKMVPAPAAIQPTRGQPAIARLATKPIIRWLCRATMSTQLTWLETNMATAGSGVPIRGTRNPNTRIRPADHIRPIACSIRSLPRAISSTATGRSTTTCQSSSGTRYRYRSARTAVRSSELEHARAPRAHVAAGATAVAAGTAVAPAHAALAAAAVHALDQLLAAAVEPLGAADLVRLQAAALGLVLAEVAELVVRVQFVLQLAHRQLDHDRVVEEAEHRHLVGDHVVGIAEVGQRREHPLAILAGQCPGLVAGHRDQVVQAHQALRDEVRQRALLRVHQQLRGAVDDLLVGFARGGLRRLCHGRLEMLQVAIVEFEVERDRHGRPVHWQVG